jgi:hypothetical protein
MTTRLRKPALALAALTFVLLLDACVCRPVHVSQGQQPTTVAALKAELDELAPAQ